MGVLDRIVEKRKQRLEAERTRLPLREVMARLKDMGGARDFASAIRRGGPAPDKTPDKRIRLIAEVKRASPSRGLIRRDFDLRAIASAYDKRADAISVLTEEDFFMGSPAFIAEVKRAAGRPVLRKDFIVDEYQVYESRLLGADAILLIAAALDKSAAREFLHMARAQGLAVLFEVHNADELSTALDVGADIIGINNRDLGTLKVDLGTTLSLLRDIPEGRIVVSESGMKKRADVLMLENTGVDAVLVGTAFMEAADPAAAVDELMGVGVA